MKRSLQEYVELVVFGLVALLVGTGLLWLVGWVFSLGGVALKWLAGLLWNLLRFIVPVAIAGGLVYFLVKAAQDRQARPATAAAGQGGAPGGPPAASPQTPVTEETNYVSTPPASPASTHYEPQPDPAAPDVTRTVDTGGEVVSDPGTQVTEAQDLAADDDVSGTYVEDDVAGPVDVEDAPGPVDDEDDDRA